MKPNRLFDIIGIVSIVVLVIVIVSKCTSDVIVEPIQTANSSKVDSLQTIIDSLQAEIEFQNKGFDSKEHRYEDVIFEYEFGLDYLEKYHPDAYRDFHRIISFSERYRRTDAQENKKRLHVEKY